MARGLRELLNATEPAYSFRLRELENLTGSKAVDITLLHEVMKATEEKIAVFGLDSSDTRDEELYMQLQRIIDDIDLRLFPVEAEIMSLHEVTLSMPFASIPILKPTVLKKILRLHPPKNVMKKLGYTSLESFLKRADIKQISLGIFIHESYSWHKKFSTQLKGLTTSDFVLKKPSLSFLPRKLLPSNTSVHTMLSGVVGLSRDITPSTNQLLEIVAKLRHIHVEGVYLKGRYNHNHFVETFIASLYHPIGPVAKVGSIPIPWESIYGIVQTDPQTILKDIDSFVGPEDYQIGGLGSLLADTLPEHFEWFRDTDCSGRPHLSFHINDVAFNGHFKVPLKDSASAYRQAALETTLLSKYARMIHDNSKILEICGAI